MSRILVAFAAVATLSAVPVAWGVTIFEYEGEPFTSVSGPFSTSDSVAGFVEFSSMPLPLSSLDETDIVDYSFTAGPLTLTPSTLSSDVFANFTFDALGEIETWVITVSGQFPGTDATKDESINTDWNGIDGDDVAIIDDVTGGIAENALTPGVWRPIPEPGTISLLGLGGMVTFLVGARRALRSNDASVGSDVF